MTQIEEAREFVQRTVLIPALEHPNLSSELKQKVKNSVRWINRFERVGDLLRYLKRYEYVSDSPTYTQLKQHGLLTFEDIVSDFEKKLGPWADDYTTFSDFVVGEEYDSFQILILAGKYDTRSGGMFVIGAPPSAVVIKATLSGGMYANEWFKPHQRLKYYLKSRSGVFKESYVENRSIIQNQDIPIYTFVRKSEHDNFIFEGVYKYKNLVKENGGSKWFELEKNESITDEEVVSREYLENDLQQKIEESLCRSDEDRRERLKIAPKTPCVTTTITKSYIRNADVIVEVLKRANGICDECGNNAPFMRKSDNSPYLEVHHLKPLALGGEDTIENAAALCPNCHRRAHFGV